MLKSISSLLLATTAVLCLPEAQAAGESPPTCDLRDTLSCPIPGQVIVYQLDCPRGDPSHKTTCVYETSLPVAQILCSSGSGNAACEAWPQSDGIAYRYVWKVLSGVTDASSGGQYNPLLLGSCRVGRLAQVAVTVIAPSGLSSTATSERFLCEANQ
ncbi:MAG: hypothetical protein R3F18_16730 [Lysobacterales bacterium]|nr:hypothetical protein [Xanthomonadales bacterium]